jgi:hypothetical protein
MVRGDDPYRTEIIRLDLARSMQSEFGTLTLVLVYGNGVGPYRTEIIRLGLARSMQSGRSTSTRVYMGGVWTGLTGGRYFSTGLTRSMQSGAPGNRSRFDQLSTAHYLGGAKSLSGF